MIIQQQKIINQKMIMFQVNKKQDTDYGKEYDGV